VKSGSGGVQVFDLVDLMLREYLNEINSKVYTTTDPAYAQNGGRLMGLGDRVTTDLFLPDGVWSLWNRGQPILLEDGKLPDKNIYGT
jgi:hypothetical protein